MIIANLPHIIVGVIILFWTFTFIYMYTQRTPLEKMAKTGHLDALKKNIKVQDINKIFPKSGLTLMMTASFYGQTEVVEYLLKMGLTSILPAEI